MKGHRSIDPLVVVVSRAEVEAGDTSSALAVLNQLTESPDTARGFVERVDIAFHGYDQTKQELFEIPEVRNFVAELDQGTTFRLFFPAHTGEEAKTSLPTSHGTVL